MKDSCEFCVKYDACFYKKKREELNNNFYPFQMKCSLYEKRKMNIETAPLLGKETEPSLWEIIFGK